MNGKLFLLLLLALISAVLPASAFSADVSDYLILQDIGAYKLSKPEKMIPGFPPIGGPRTFDCAAVVSGTGHFSDHPDITYEVKYYGDTDTKGNPTVQVTQHAGGESDQWLLHEIEDNYRDGDDSDGRLGMLSGTGVKIRELGGNKIIYWGLGGGSYTWISGLKLIEIKYVDLQSIKPKSLEVIQAYLQKHPSTIPATLVLDKSHDDEWIKVEIDRRLWLSEKWLSQIQADDAKLSDRLYNVVKNMKVFLSYREKYFGVKATDELAMLHEYQFKQDIPAIRRKLTNYQAWWPNNKASNIRLP